jgi:hypothetical protein
MNALVGQAVKEDEEFYTGLFGNLDAENADEDDDDF